MHTGMVLCNICKCTFITYVVTMEPTMGIDKKHTYVNYMVGKVQFSILSSFATAFNFGN